MQSKSVSISKQQAQTVSFIFDRLVQIVKHRFGCELGYFDLSEDEPDHKLLSSLLSKNNHVKLNDRLFFPVKVHNQLVGAAEVREQKTLLNPSERDHLLKIIGLVLESTLLTKQTLDELDSLEQQLHLLSEESNVIRLNQYSKSKRTTGDHRTHFSSKTRFGVPCLIECQSAYDLFRMACEIHYYSNRHAFINLYDLEESALASIHEFKKLGPVSIFISEVSELPRWMQKSLVNYFKSSRGKDDPQFIVGSRLSYSDLLGNSCVENELVQCLCVAYLKMTRPFEDYIGSGVIEFFYDSLIQGSNEPTLEL